MVVGNGSAPAPPAAEEAPLLIERRRVASQDDRLETLTNPSARSDEENVEEEEDSDKANQHIGRVRALLVMLSLWGLIFLQGGFSTLSLPS